MIFLICCFVFAYAQASVWDNLTANIVVVEFLPVQNYTLTVQEKVNLNTLAYQEIVSFAGANSNLDLIIFPEATIQNNPQTAVEITINTTCSPETCPQPLSEISTIARSYNTYIVINLVEKSKCDETDQRPNCKNFGFRFYNTNVVFDRTGKIINIYRKYNLFGEFEKDQPDNPDTVIIKTDFGVNFGTFTCFDILFKSPAQDLVKEKVDGIIFPTMWFSELPFLTAMQAQQMWAHTHDIAFFAAGANNPLVGSGGSGVYRGSQGKIVGGIIGAGGTESYRYQITNGKVTPPPAQGVDELAKQMDGFYLKRDLSLDDYQWSVLNTSVTDIQKSVCYESLLCCNFTIKISTETPKPNLNFYTYFLVAYSGVRSFDGVYNGGTEVCGVIACLNSSLSSCGSRFPKYEEVQWPVTFEEITIEANFEKSDNKTQYPNSLLSSMHPIEASETVWSSVEAQENGKTVTKRTWRTSKAQNRILTFAVYGRDFGNDSLPSTNDGNGTEDAPGGSENLKPRSTWLLLSLSVLISTLTYAEIK